MINKNFYCKICGYNLDYNPWGEDGKNPDYSFCSSCGVEFGYQDYSLESILEFRNKWIENGMVWSEEKYVPKSKDWNPINEIKNIGIDFSKKEIVEEYKKEIPNIEEIIQPYS